MFDREWLEHVNKLEYPFDLANTLTYKWGYPDLESFIKEAGKFSLLNDGTLEKPCTKMLLVNGTHDEIFPVDDLFVALEHGMPKLARLVNGKKHMGVSTSQKGTPDGSNSRPGTRQFLHHFEVDLRRPWSRRELHGPNEDNPFSAEVLEGVATLYKGKVAGSSFWCTMFGLKMHCERDDRA